VLGEVVPACEGFGPACTACVAVTGDCCVAVLLFINDWCFVNVADCCGDLVAALLCLLLALLVDVLELFNKEFFIHCENKRNTYCCMKNATAVFHTVEKIGLLLHMYITDNTE
jgi:hypothetical protein